MISSGISTTLYSTLVNGQFACPDVEVIFTCETRGSESITWNSAQYVGNPLGFLGVLRQVNDTRKSSSNPETFATLTKNELDNGVLVLRSTLRIKASLSLSSASVTCVHTDASNSRSISFTVLRTYV